ncbi:hypothetical protein N7G03_004510 [Salmonella enterica]|uniref:hypothetical protein n=1 Tax=Salmonella enterica TaxID=28901 RepID=UPI00129B6404|nr:hypothetical protein [Salmonella enterica]EAX8328945.1 hypothetical protein [Salmonella enterica]EIS6182920.1 hypothetical protein [Salmonella enterica]EIY6234414.1 hypothetical protein [Salmonella enterica]EJV5153134.1 hypothetical protein [Salmonella enterica]EJW7250418.1 hypothetical protein [Salmonella enterica]
MLIEVEEFNELVSKVDAISNVVSILLDALGEEQPALYKKVIENIQDAVTGIRNTLGEVNENDIVEYAYVVAESMEQFLPFDDSAI